MFLSDGNLVILQTNMRSGDTSSQNDRTFRLLLNFEDDDCDLGYVIYNGTDNLENAGKLETGSLNESREKSPSNTSGFKIIFNWLTKKAKLKGPEVEDITMAALEIQRSCRIICELELIALGTRRFIGINPGLTVWHH